jgi:hypothetical protein
VPSVSPAASTASRQASGQHPGQTFSPPVPTSSASSSHFPFPVPFVPGPRSSSLASPGIPSTASPVSYNGPHGAKFNPRQSISIPATNSPFQVSQAQSPNSWTHPAMLLQSLSRGESPLNGLVSPTSPFQPTGSPAFNLHQRHQSLQYPLLPHQVPLPRASPLLHEVREVDEEQLSKSPSKTPEPPKRNPDSLQAEIDEAEYHLEEQMRNQLETDEYSPHNEDEKAKDAVHARHQSVQFAIPEPLASNAGPGPVLHHPRPHSRGHSLSQKFFKQEEASRDSTDEGSAFGNLNVPAVVSGSSSHNADEAYEIETNPSNLGTPVQNFDFASVFQPSSHQRAFSTASNPWNDAGSNRSGTSRRSSHGSKPSLSKLNVEAPEFKLNPESSFRPSQFVFGANAFQPAPSMFTAKPFIPQHSATSSQFSLPSSKINAAAPVFSPGQSDFNFSTSGPKFRPDAPAFTPFGNISDSMTSPLSGSDSKRTSSIFGNIDIPDIVKPARRSKAIPIVKPASREASQTPADESVQEDLDGRLTDESRVKRARGAGADDDAVPLFAERPTTPVELGLPSREASLEKTPQPEDFVDHKSADEAAHADTSMSSTVMSDPMTSDAKPTAPATATSPSETSPLQESVSWSNFEFDTKDEMQSFVDAIPPGDQPFIKGHKKSLSAAAKPFVPGGLSFEEPEPETDQENASEPTPGTSFERAVETQGTHEAGSEPTQETTQEITEDITQEMPSPPAEPLISPIGPAPVAQLRPKGLAASRFAASPPPSPPQPKGLGASLFAAFPTPETEPQPPPSIYSEDAGVEALPSVERSPSPGPAAVMAEKSTEETVGQSFRADEEHPSYNEIDAVMNEIHKNDPNMGVNRYHAESPKWHQPSPTRHISLAAVTNSSPFNVPPEDAVRQDGRSPTPRQYHALPQLAVPIMSRELPDDPFLDLPLSGGFSGPVHNLNAAESVPHSEWESGFSDAEKERLQERMPYLDGRMNEMVGRLLASRLDPLEKSLDAIQEALAQMPRHTSSSRRDRRSMSAEVQNSDADDEDEEPAPRRSMSPQRNKRLEQIRVAVMEAFAAQQRAMPPPAPAQAPEPATSSAEDSAAVLKALEEMKEQFGTQLRLDFRGEDLRNIVEDAVERRMPPTPQPPADDDLNTKLGELQAKVIDMEQRLYLEQTKLEQEVAERRAAQDVAAELERKLQSAELRVEIEIMNRSAFDQRVSDLDDRLRHQEEQTEDEVKARRAAEDRLSEVQRLLRIASEEENRLREVVEEREQKVKSLEQSGGKTTMRLALLEAAQTNNAQSQSDLTNKLNAIENELRSARQESSHWRAEAERAIDDARRRSSDLAHVTQENKQLHKLLDTLGTQLEENERVREGWRSKFISVQDDMARSAWEITQENARRAKKEQALIARQEVLDAKLQAEARTRERLESEIERLEGIERQGMRAVTESKRLEGLLGELRAENHQLQQNVMRYQREFDEARESGAREVQRTRETLQAQLEEANEQVNVVREDLEEQLSKLRADLDHAKLDVDAAKAQSEMLLEEAQATGETEISKLREEHQSQVEDLQVRFERQLSTAVDEAQSHEQSLLDRLSISTSKTEHLQDRINHLEEKLDIANQAARAAAEAASGSLRSPTTAAPTRPAVPRGMELPEKISPQALRESIMVLQEQLQAREQRIEQLEATVSKLDPDSSTKIAKRDDEIIWLRELLAVRHGDLQDIIAALSTDAYDPNRVKDAAIRLDANLRMEEQERERAMNGGSSVNLPNIAQTIRDAATPRVAQAASGIAAALGNWRKGLSSPALSARSPAATHTPARPSMSTKSSLMLGGLLTPPASGSRQTPPAGLMAAASKPQAFSAGGRRFTGQSQASVSSRRAEKMPAPDTPPRQADRREPVTPPMMERSAYDSDAHAGEFDGDDFFED